MPTYNLDTLLGITHELSQNSERDVYGIPYVEKQDFEFEKINSDYTLAKYNNCHASTPLANYKIGHGFMYDKPLWTIFKKPVSFLKKMGRFAAWVAPDLSIDMNASVAQAIGIVEQTRWLARFGQENGQTVFASVGWSREELDSICFAGLRDGAIFFISTLGVDNEMCRPFFLRGYKKMRELFPRSKIVCLGSRLEGMDDDVIYVDYRESFGYEDHQQLRLFPQVSLKKGGF